MKKKEVINRDENGLTPRERFYFNVMKNRSGVLYIKSPPGMAKSSILKELSMKLAYNYIDVRLSQLDETDISGFPQPIEKMIGKKMVTVSSFAIPEWAALANSGPSIIHFEELNRAPLAVRNAALQILQERGIGHAFKFNDDVYMCASGNLGEDDGTDVEDFDRALNNRLIHVEHKLTFAEWVEGFAAKRVHPSIVKFLEHNLTHFYKDTEEGDKKQKEHSAAFASPRTWTYLSDYIIGNYSKESTPHDWLGEVEEHGVSFIGPSVHRFIRWVKENMHMTIQQIVNEYAKFEEEIKKIDRVKKSELIEELKKIELKKLTEEQAKNIIKFLESCDKDEVAGYFMQCIEHVDEKEMKNNIGIRTIFKAMKPYSAVLENVFFKDDKDKEKTKAKK